MDKRGQGVHQSYRDEAQKGCDVLFRVKIRGRSMLVDDIPLHMSLKIFSDPKEYDLKELKAYVEKHDICSPDPKTVTFRPIIFNAEKSKLDYYMLKIEGLPPKYKALYDHYDKVGNVYKNFMTHVTIDKPLYDDLVDHPLKPNEIEFGNLIVEHGAGNTFHEFKKSEGQPLEKGIKHVAAGFAIAGAMAAPHQANAPAAPAPKPAVQQQSQYDSGKMLRTIASVETQSGHNMAHKPVGGIHGGESAFGKYGLMPNTIRETIGMHRDLKQKHGNALKLKGDDMRRYMEDNPGLEDTIAQRHLQRLEHHFGKDPSKLGYAWLEGIRGTYKAGKENKNINDHWHVKKIRDAYGKEK
jgi:hypothetical protein